MKKTFWISTVLIISAGILVLTFIWGYDGIVNNLEKTSDSSQLQQSTADRDVVNLYFANKDKTKIIIEKREIQSTNKKSMPLATLNELLKGPVNSEMKRAIPEGTKVLGVKQEGTLVIVNLSKEYYGTEDNAGDLLARYSVVNTLCDMNDVQSIKILIEGEELKGPDGRQFGALGKDDAVFKATVDKKTNGITLYFGGNNAEHLIAERREILANDEGIEKQIIKELIKGPNNKSLSKTVPQETKLISIETKEGTCFVNFSQEFKTKHWGGSTGEIFTIYSIVNSLTELSHIKRIQFLIEGQKLEVFEHMVFNEPFERDSSMLQK